jgi:hypothetical protein
LERYRGVRRDPGDTARLAPATGHPQLGLQQSAASRPAAHGSRDPQAGDPHGHGQSDLGAPARARRARQARPSDRCLHGVAGPAYRGDRPCTPPRGSDLEAVPDRASPRHSRGRFHSCGHGAAPPPLCPDRHRARQPPRPLGRHHRQPGRRLDDTGSSQLPDGSRATPDHGQVPDQGSCRPVDRLLRRRVPGGGDQDSGQPAASAESKRDLRKDDRYPAPGGLGPAADRQ